jgi:hypothetical protein
MRAQPEAEPTSACLRAGGWSQVQTPPLPQLASRNLRDVLYVDYDTIEKVTESTEQHGNSKDCITTQQSLQLVGPFIAM